MLRPYQQAAVDAVISHAKKRTSPCLLELATGAGKSHIVAALARFFAEAAPAKRVLCIAPSKELVEQNYEKYTTSGFKASIYCASAGQKCLRQQVIFASPQTAAGNIEKIAHMGVSAIIIDEAHGITPTLTALIDSVKNYTASDIAPNKNVRIIGMTATPYRLGSGYIYAIDATEEQETINDDTRCRDPFFNRLLYRITAGELIGMGFLTSVQIGESEEHYDTSALKLSNLGKFNAKSVSDAFEHNSKTELIIKKIIAIAQHTERRGVMIFASTISHAEEICRYLPAGQWRMVTGKTPKSERKKIINEYKSQQFLYIVNVDVLTTGFDAPHVDLVAILRATESAGLLQQIIGRGLRLSENKEFCLVLDYAENIERHGLESDLFTPDIKARRAAGEGEYIEVTCPCCGIISDKKRRNDDAYKGLMHDKFGNFIVAGTEVAVSKDSDGEVIEWQGMPLMMTIPDPSVKDEFGECGTKELPVPAHYSRRCGNPEASIIQGQPVACVHRFSLKLCPECMTENDIAARHCIGCRARLVDPNKKLRENAGRGLILEVGELATVKCTGASYAAHVSASGNKTLKAVYSTEVGKITAWHSDKQHWIFNKLCSANGVDAESVASDYSQCESWTFGPSELKVKKTIQNGYSRFEIKQIKF